MKISDSAAMTPHMIVQELDRFVVGQEEAKKSVAIALRNRWRRKQVAQPLQGEIVPHNILMVGPTGVGKTEIARRLAKLTSSPFIKIEATKFTEVGYVGRDVDSIIRDLLDIAVNLVRSSMHQKVTSQAREVAKRKILDILVGENASPETREKFEQKLDSSALDNMEIEIVLSDNHAQPSNVPMFDMPGGQMGILNLGELISKAFTEKKTKTVKTSVKEAMELLAREESDALIDNEKVILEAKRITEEEGIVFIDEIDKITSNGSSSGKGEVSREGVQRDLLPLLEGTNVTTKYGTIQTSHILFIASGAFHIAKPSDLLPELQGRLPIRVELKPISEEDMIKILKDPEHSLTKQYQALLSVENVTVSFTDDGIEKIAKVAALINHEIENIGARRLHTILEKLLEDISFNAHVMQNQTINLNAQYVEEKLEHIVKTSDLSNFIL
ncbi:ATP-dependent protease ATPase subunit HslU [Candidatus Lariskella endosymbiont of Hedychridium roseum]|uniref:ATP-dependent protease ATPase subunit HslU n=1 Tax=Candidatus Lariskella endosymbiont of Hedychridium roseum TaxID=3077949 RepID=UPI0030CEB27D